MANNERESVINGLFTPKKTESGRLELLLAVLGDMASDSPLADLQTFEGLTQRISDWENGYVIFHDHQNLKNALCQRYQKSRLCYIHGPVVLQHYLVCLAKEGNPVSNPGMINILHADGAAVL